MIFNEIKNVFTDADWRQQQRVHQASYNLSASNSRVRSTTRNILPELPSAPVDCVASRTRSRTPQNPQPYFLSSNSFELPFPTGYTTNRRPSTYTNNNTTVNPIYTSHPSTSRGSRG